MGWRDEITFPTKEAKQFLGVKFITESCVLLNLSYQSRYKALILFYNFNEEIDFAGLCMASVLLASKLEEEVCTLKKVVYVFNYLYTRYESKPAPLTNRLSIRLKEGCILAEAQILKSLGFDVSFEDVYGEFIDFLQTTDFSPDFIGKAIRVFNTMIQWPEAVSFDPGSLVMATIESLFSRNERFEDYTRRYRLFQERRFNLQTYEEISTTKNIGENLITGFVKRQKRK